MAIFNKNKRLLCAGASREELLIGLIKNVESEIQPPGKNILIFFNTYR